MLTTEEQIQKTVASLDAGNLAKWVWRGVFAFVAVGLSVFFLVHEFHGLPIGAAMDQAQIGREIARGHGWQTKFIRPLAIGELQRNGKNLQNAIAYDTYNAPVGPLLDAAALYIPLKEGWKFEKTDIVSSGDKAIAVMGILFFLGSLWMLFLIALELFDRRLAYLATGLTMVCDMMWQYSISGLPLMALLFLLHVNVYFLLKAMRARYLNAPHLGRLAALGVGFGLMALTQQLSIFIFFPVLVFAFFFFRPRPWGALLMLGLFLAVYTPWLVRNALVCGDFRGLAGFCGLDGIVRSESGHMRRFAIDLGETSGNYFAENFRANLTGQINRLVEYLGWSCMAPLALVSVLHAFKRPITATFRWLLFSMFASAIFGMAIFGMKQEQSLAANQFYLLFTPLLICYGLAYVLVQWDRRIGLGFISPAWNSRSGLHYVLRISLVIAIFLLSGIPLVARLALSKSRWQVEWPPYMPPYIAAMGHGFAPEELIGSDMPWAVAWYADRRSVWLPYEPQDLQDLSDYQKLGGTVAGLYFTPISGTMNTLEDLVNGEYRHWTNYIVRTVNLKKTPYPVKTVMGMPDCVLYMNTDRRPAMAK